MHEIDQELIMNGDMVIDEPNQAMVDGLSAGVLAGTVDMYAAKRAIEHDDRPAAIELLAKSGLGALVMEHCRNCGERRVFLRTQFGSSYRWTCERCGTDMEEKDND